MSVQQEKSEEKYGQEKLFADEFLAGEGSDNITIAAAKLINGLTEPVQINRSLSLAEALYIVYG